MSKLLPKISQCQNCDSPTKGNYCPVCGQDSRDHSVSMRLLFQDLASDIFTYDSRFFRSFLPLIFKPGALTVEYTQGRRVRFIPPLRLYIFISLIFFFVVTVQVRDSIREKEEREATNAPSDSTVVERVLSLHAAVPDSLDDGMTPVVWVADRLALSQTKSFELPEDGDWSNVNWDEMDVDTIDSDGTMNVTIFGQPATYDKQGFITSGLKILPKMIFLLLPLFALLLALVYIRRRKKFIEHLVLSLHLHAFMFLIFTIGTLISNVWLSLAIIIFIHVYIYLALRRVYGQGWLKTFFKFMFLSNAYNMILLALVILVALSTAQIMELSKEHPLLVQLILG